MKVGLLDVLGARYTRYWTTFLEELGLEVVTPHLPAESAFALGFESLPDAPAQVQLVLGRVIELGQVDLVLLPQTLAVWQDAWASDLTELLPRRISGLPTLKAVPDGGSAMTDAALELGQQLTHNAGQVRLALSKAKPLSLPVREQVPTLSRASQTSVAVIGPASLLRDEFLIGPLRGQLESAGLFAVWASDLPREQLRERGQRFTLPSGKALPAGEADLYGAQQWLEGKGAVRGLIYACTVRDAATFSALTRLEQTARKPALLLELDPQQPRHFQPQLSAFAAELLAVSSTPSQELS
ncbi:hypothetical protein EHF33_03305 [Deinococcus psychrotolerans]|uniref:Uncharacterized protein n=1 Tax=Deinococcus psychrotolerans TaxID=2489213 RepID=A0A3G8YCG1_9DEIO|nr:hypothetical protein [Deinococcus psychrotolerans]AZI41897.1 hypothetical protein EHF33_03305 [Deinococcus psychrotolerans]